MTKNLIQNSSISEAGIQNLKTQLRKPLDSVCYDSKLLDLTCESDTLEKPSAELIFLICNIDENNSWASET